MESDWTMETRLDSVTGLARMFIKPALGNGSIACDATCGNGHDTVFLASLVGREGMVYGFDIQEKALQTTRQFLIREGLQLNVSLIRDGHENMDKYIGEPLHAVMFNLGYLPGGSHGIITETATTLAALSSTLYMLKKGGRISVVSYTGHQGGDTENEAIHKFFSGLDSSCFAVIHTEVLNRTRPVPELFLVEKVG